MKNKKYVGGFSLLSIIALFLLAISVTPKDAFAVTESKFNFSNEAYSVSGWINVSGDPKTAVRTKTDSTTGIGVRSITANWNNANGNNAWNGAGQTVDDGGGFIVPAGVLLNYWYNTNSIFATGKYHAQIFGLNTAKTYTLSFTASRSNQNGASAPRIADYNIRGASVLTSQSLNVWQNTSRKVVFANVKPNTSGVIDIGVNKKADGTGGIFGYLGGLIVTEDAVAGNSSPTVNAGTDQSITLPTSSITLTGTGSDTDGTIASYAWTKVSGGTATIVAPTAASTSVTGLATGTYTFRLTVTDNSGATASDDVVVTVNAVANVVPTVNAGIDQTYTMPVSSFTLVGTGSDTDGTITSYKWTETSSNYGTIVSSTSATTAVKDIAAGTYTFRLTVTDNSGATASDDVVVTVNPHVFSACTPKTIVILGSSTSAGYGLTPISDSYANRFTSYMQSLGSTNSVINLAVGGYTSYQLLPTGSSVPADRPSPDTNANITKALSYSPAAILVNLPSNDVANGFANSEQQANLNTIISTASAANIPVWVTTTQPRNMDDASIAKQVSMRDWILSTYGSKSINFWELFANADGTINSAYDQGDGIHLNNIAHKKLYARVAESSLLTDICSTPLAVNSSPTVNAGTDQSITLPTSSITLTGTGSDTDGTIASYAWTKVSGGTATIVAPTAASTSVTGLATGTYTFRLTVTDNSGATASDDVVVTVNAVANVVPTLSVSITSVLLDSVAVDTDGTITSYKWAEVSGPNTATISTPNSSSTVVSNLVSGTYIFNQTVTDNSGATTVKAIQFSIN